MNDTMDMNENTTVKTITSDIETITAYIVRRTNEYLAKNYPDGADLATRWAARSGVAEGMLTGMDMRRRALKYVAEMEA